MKTFNYGGVSISVGINENNSDRINPNLSNEKEILNKWITYMNDRYLTNKFIINENAASYTTLSYNDYDVLRLHYGSETKWVQLLIATKYKKNYINDSRFDSEKNKNKVYWKMNIEDDDINYFVDILDEIYDFISK